jgi:hypothetical protein
LHTWTQKDEQARTPILQPAGRSIFGLLAGAALEYLTNLLSGKHMRFIYQ